jgi:hypothetical protein
VYYRKIRSYFDRKMCVVLPHILARGPLRAPVQPPASGSFRALNPSRASKTYRRFIPRKGAFGAPLHPIDPFRKTRRAFHSPLDPSTMSWRLLRRDNSIEATRPPIGCRSGLSRPDTHDQTRAVWRGVSVSPLNPDQGAVLRCANKNHCTRSGFPFQA